VPSWAYALELHYSESLAS